MADGGRVDGGRLRLGLEAGARGACEVKEAPRLNLSARWLKGCGLKATFFRCGSWLQPGQIVSFGVPSSLKMRSI